MLAEKYGSVIEKIFAKYPAGQKRSAVMPLIFLAQREYGYISAEALDEIANLIDLDPTEVASLVGFYTLFHDKPEGKIRIQVCTDLPCALRGADDFVKQLCDQLGVESGGTTDGGAIMVEEVMCLAACDRAPMLQIQDADGIHYHYNQTVQSVMELVEKIRTESSID